jgi:predicted nuclease of restriction endonuclease-like RecB superfamily
MIPSDLLRYKIDYKNNKIHPILCSLNNNSTEYQTALKVIEIFDVCYKNKNNKEKLGYMVRLLEHSQKDYKLVRGICSVLEKKCAFDSIFESEKNSNYQSFDSPKERVRKLTPAGIRRLVFDESASNNIATTDHKRNEILKTVSDKLETSTETIVKLMWSDLEENTIISRYSSPDPLTLLVHYNVSLIQTLLFNCLRIVIKINSTKSIGLLWKKLLREVKRLGLMYWLEIDRDKDNNPDSTNGEDANNIICTVEGALNVVKLTEKYGNAIAKLVPLIFKADNWSIKADILRVTGNGNRAIYSFQMSEQSHSDFISSKNFRKTQKKQDHVHQQATEGETTLEKNAGLSPTGKSTFKGGISFSDKAGYDDDDDDDAANPVSYDSNIERTFSQKFELFNTGWSIEREPEPLITKSKTAFIPDFILTKHEIKVLVEIIGFWTREYLERKIKKISEIIENYDNPNFYIILIINFENMAVYETNQQQGQQQVHSFASMKNKSNVLITPYKNEHISFKEIMPFLKDIERKHIELNYGKKSGKDKVLQEIDKFLIEFTKSSDAMATWQDINESARSGQTKNKSQNFDLKEIMENNVEFKSAVEKKLSLNNIAIVKDFIFKETFIKETSNELKDRKTKSLKDACEFLSAKKVSEKIHIDLLIFMGFKINWNGLDYSESEIIFGRQ